MREIPQSKFWDIEEKHGRITKSIFVTSSWIFETKRFEYISRKLDNKDTLKYIWKHRNDAINEMLKTGLLEIKIHKPSEDKCLWLYVLSITREGVEINLTIPYLKFRKIIDIKHDEIEHTDCNRDMVIVDGAEATYRKRRFKLNFVIQNIDKCKDKLIDKMRGN